MKRDARRYVGDKIDQVAEILWNAAMELEVGDLDDALERLRRAQERLSEAMRQGASDEEIAKARKVAFMASRTNTLLSIPMLMSMVGFGHGGFFI